MKLLRRFLGVLWTFAAAAPLAVPAEGQAEAGTATVSAPGRAPRPESRPSLGAVRIGLGESVLRDLKTPFVSTPSFRLQLTTTVRRSDGPTVRWAGGQTVRHSQRARAPPQLT